MFKTWKDTTVSLRSGIFLISLFTFLVLSFQNCSQDAQIQLANTGSAVHSSTTVTTTANFYVSPLGNDSWTGTLPDPNSSNSDGPFLTVPRAQVAVQNLLKTQTSGAITTMLRGGNYYLKAPLNFTSLDSGSSNLNIIWTNYPNETPVISGGQPVTGWTISGGFWQASLPVGIQTFSQLTYNGVRRFRSRSTPGSYLTIASLIQNTGTNAGCPVCTSSACVGTPSATVCRDRIGYASGTTISSSWHNLSNIEVPIFANWTMSRMRVSSIDTSNQIIYFTGPVPNDNFDAPKLGKRFLLENIKELLLPGQWYLDENSTGVPTTLYYMPNSGELLSSNPSIIVPQIQQILVANNVNNLTFSGLTFSDTNFVVPSAGYQSQEAEANLLSGVTFTNSNSNLIDGCTFSHFIQHGLKFNGTSWNNTVQNSLIYDIGIGGIMIGNYPSAGQTNTNVTAFTKIQNSVIASIGRFLPAGNGIQIGNSHHNTIQNVDIYDTYTVGITMGKYFQYTDHSLNHDNLLQFNHLHDLFQGVMEDGGAIHNLGSTIDTADDPTSTGTVIQYNKIHDVMRYSGLNGYGGGGLYFDQGTTNITAKNNLIYRTGPSLFVNYAMNNTVTNNIFAYGNYNPRGQFTGNGQQKMGVFYLGTNDGQFVGNIMNNIIYYSGSQDLLGGVWQQSLSGSLVCTNSSVSLQVACPSRFQFDKNIYYNETTSNILTWDGYLFSKWIGFQEDSSSILSTTPIFTCPNNTNGCSDNYSLIPSVPASTIGFVPFDTYYNQMGLQPNSMITDPLPAPQAFPVQTW